MKVKTKVRSGALDPNHNESLNGTKAASQMKVRTKVRAGGGAIGHNHNQATKGLKVASRVRAGRRPGRPR